MRRQLRVLPSDTLNLAENLTRGKQDLKRTEVSQINCSAIFLWETSPDES